MITSLVLDSSAVSALAERSPQALALLRELAAAGLWPPVVSTAVLVESLRGDAGVALAEPAGSVLIGDTVDLQALAANSNGVHIIPV